MGDVSRRAVLGAGAGIAGALTLGLGEGDAAAVTAPGKASTVSNAIPARSHYARSLGKIFTAQRSGHTYRMRLQAIHDGAPSANRLHAFTLVFAPVDGSKPHDGVYVLRSRAVGAHHLFLSTIGTGRGLQAVINRHA